MIRPDDEDKPFVARWNSLARVLLVESSVKAVARAAMDYADFYDGSRCHPSSARIARESLHDERTVRAALAHLRALGMAERVAHGVAHRGIADEYQLHIPPYWDGLAVLGPHSRKFTCLACGKEFNAPAAGRINDDGKAVWDLWKLCFCKPPRKKKGRDAPDCWAVWNRDRQLKGEALWSEIGDTARWKLFREARSDDW
jgi:hypothetical protein